MADSEFNSHPTTERMRKASAGQDIGLSSPRFPEASHGVIGQVCGTIRALSSSGLYGIAHWSPELRRVILAQHAVPAAGHYLGIVIEEEFVGIGSRLVRQRYDCQIGPFAGLETAGATG